MPEHGEGQPEPIIGAEQKSSQTVSNPTYEQAARNASNALNNRDLNPQSPSFKQKALGVLAGLGIAFGGGVAASDKVQETVSDAAGTVKDIGETGLNVVKAPYEVAKDAGNVMQNVAEAITPENSPDKPRNPDQVMVGNVSVEVTKNLNVRTSPNIPGKEFAGNEIGWDKVNLVNQVVVGGKIQLVPVEFKDGDILNIENPEYVFGQASGGGFGHDEKSKWLMLYTQNSDGELRAVYIADQAETSAYVKTTSEQPKYIDAKTLQDSSNGVKIVQFSEALPDKVNQITIQSSAPQVTQQPQK